MTQMFLVCLGLRNSLDVVNTRSYRIGRTKWSGPPACLSAARSRSVHAGLLYESINMLASVSASQAPRRLHIIGRKMERTGIWTARGDRRS